LHPSFTAFFYFLCYYNFPYSFTVPFLLCSLLSFTS
jgi:hypothetical protein